MREFIGYAVYAKVNGYLAWWQDTIPNDKRATGRWIFDGKEGRSIVSKERANEALKDSTMRRKVKVYRVRKPDVTNREIGLGKDNTPVLFVYEEDGKVMVSCKDGDYEARTNRVNCFPMPGYRDGMTIPVLFKK